MTEEYTLNKPTAITCPECGGAMSTEDHNGLKQFRCHIGHVLTAETMLAAHFCVLEVKLSACLVALNERAELCRQMGGNGSGGTLYGATLESARRQALERAEVIKGLLESEWVDTGQAYAAQIKRSSV
jgi:two-component system chemotaxis response regulator CheB